ncbi:MAG: peptidase, partial [Alcaligenaceae bacterium]|nr:peptidase [Alcaligenaceae bacterium]
MLPRSLGLLLCLVLSLAQAAPSLESRQAEAQQERSALRAQIRDLQGRIEGTESLRQDAGLKLKASEEAISDIGRRLDELARRHTRLRESLKALDAAIAAQSGELKRQQDALAAQLRAQYASGLSPWTALLSGDDPQEIGRELAYLAYLSRARTQALGNLRNSIDKLSALQAEADAGRKDLQALLADTEAQKKNLQAQQAERRKVLADIQSQLQAQRGQARELETREQRLGTLIKGLGGEIERAEARARL